ncbi:MAG TPA: DNA-primase RepB domain-containing protein [Bryobacteraceae bacterium]|nr:DNA-primase RepB domain-containing protein [Bryobacteraceae bacterium]
MLDAFESVGAVSFDVTFTTRAGKKVRFEKQVPAERLQRTLPFEISGAAAHGHNVIVRPHARHALLIQLDDLDAPAIQKVKPAAFLGLETSPGNYQAWVAVPSAEADKDFARRLRKGAGADDTASGATRVAGSVNFKEKYWPDFPLVKIAHSAPGLMTNTAHLEALGLVAAPEEPRAGHVVSVTTLGNRKWPSYARCVEGAPENRDKTGPDISRADFTWCMTALTWGWGVEDVASKLMQESAKARENGERYALMTAQNAAAAVERNRQRSRA